MAFAVTWMKEPEDHNYPAALSYLSLIYDGAESVSLVRKLQKAKLSEFKAKDIFRASGLSLLGVSNYHVEKNTKKIKAGKSLSPVLLVRSDQHCRVIIADGYHRLCAVYLFDEDAYIACKIV